MMPMGKQEASYQDNKDKNGMIRWYRFQTNSSTLANSEVTNRKKFSTIIQDIAILLIIVTPKIFCFLEVMVKEEVCRAGKFLPW